MASKGKRNVMMPEINRYQVSTIMNYVLKNFSYRVAYLSKSANLSVLVNHITNCRLARSFGKPSNLLSRSLSFRVWVITKDNRHTKRHYSKCILRGPFVSVNSLLLSFLPTKLTLIANKSKLSTYLIANNLLQKNWLDKNLCL